MRARRRQLRLSLAAKCQLLFGAAVVLIIAAALLVPWKRIEELTDQLNQRTAAALALTAVDQHTRLHERGTAEPATGPTTEPAEYPPPRLVSAATPPEELSAFDRRALERFIEDPDRDAFARTYERRDGGEGYRYARALYSTSECNRCHRGAAPAVSLPPRALTHTTQPAATQPRTLLGMVVVDIPSQVEPMQKLLNRTFMLTAGLLAGILALLVLTLIISKLILQPVRVLQETAEKVSQGDLNIRSDINTGDEFQQLSETFNTMLANLKAGEDQLRAVNKSLDLKLGQLAESNLALYESNRLKSEFLANVSHELRTPLNSILGFADLLKESPASADAKVARYIQNIRNSGKNLLELINDLLDLAKIEAGRMEVRSEPLSLSDLFEGLSSILKPLCEAKGLAINASVAADVPILQTDPAKLQQVLYNFLSNAIKFSPPGAGIELTATRESEERVRISVTDHGPGIAAEKQAMIFEKFRQADSSVTRTHSGTGLGLAISRELTILLGGTLGVNSAEGAGATFWVSLPLKISPGAKDLRGKLVLT